MRGNSGVSTGRYASGFTLVELVAVVVLLGIIAAASSQFIGQGVGIYRDSVDRDRLQQQARFVIERMSRELRNAMPGSLRVANNSGVQCIEFLPIVAASSYLGQATDGPRTNLNVVDFNYSLGSGDQLAIYPLDAASVYGSASVLANLTSASAPAGNQQQLSFSSKIFPYESPSRRFFIVNEPVSFCAAAQSLTRHEGYSMTAAQSVPPANAVLLTESLEVSDQSGAAIDVFQFTSGTTRRAAVVHMNLYFSDVMTLGDEWLSFSHEVFVRNTQ